MSDVVAELRAQLDRPADPNHLGYGWTTAELARLVGHLEALLDVAETAIAVQSYVVVEDRALFVQSTPDTAEAFRALFLALARLDGDAEAA